MHKARYSPTTNKNEMHSARCIPILLALAMLLSPSVQAAQPKPEPKASTQLSTVVVTGTRTERDINDTPVRTQVVSHEDIEQEHARTVKEALENVPGVHLTKVHGKSGYEVSMQGLSGDQVLILIDGMPIIASTGSTVDLSQLGLADVQRIEVVKGALSAQYGSAAMGGVINIITRSPKPGFAGAIVADSGSYGQQNPSGKTFDLANNHLQARLEGGSQQWRVRVVGDLRNSDGFDPAPNTWARPGDQIKRKHAKARVEWHPDPAGQFYLQGSWFQEKSEIRFAQQFPGFTIEQSKQEEATRKRLTGGGSWQWGQGWQLKLDAMTANFNDDSLEFASQQVVANRQAELSLQHVTALLDLPMWGVHVPQLGLAYHRETLEQFSNQTSELDRNGRVARDSKEIFFQDDIFLTRDLELLPGVRYQYDSDFGGHAAPKLNLRYVLVRDGNYTASMRAGWGSGYRVPNLKERHFRFDHSQLGYVVIGNPDLQPETSSSWQLGWNLDWRNQLNIDISLFYNRLKNLIQVDQESAPVINGISQFRFGNINRAKTQGGEIAVQWLVNHSLDLSAAYTYTRTEDLSTSSELTRRPRHQGRIAANWEFLPDTSLSARLRAQSRELINTATADYSPGWITADLSLNHDLNQHLRLFAGVDNLFDRQRNFSNANDFGPLAGRFVYLGMRYAWGK